MEAEINQKQPTVSDSDNVSTSGIPKAGEIVDHQALKGLNQSADHDTVFQAQAALVNQALQDIGMGKYQSALFCLAGWGWLCDQVSRVFTLRDDVC
jgi:hypothetical protein